MQTRMLITHACKLIHECVDVHVTLCKLIHERIDVHACYSNEHHAIDVYIIYH